LSGEIGFTPRFETNRGAEYRVPSLLHVSCHDTPDF
jgi:hypothetical protein